jgi:hypothetical protein
MLEAVVQEGSLACGASARGGAEGREHSVSVRKVSASKSPCQPAHIFAITGYLVATMLTSVRGYRLGPDTVVRCREGHLFTTTWILGASLKAIRLGWYRFQRCPVDKHWALVKPVRESDLTEDELGQAKSVRDTRIP